MAPFRIPGFIIISKRAAIRLNQKANRADILEKEIARAPILTTDELDTYGEALIKCARCPNINVLCGDCITLHTIADLAHKAGTEPPEAI